MSQEWTPPKKWPSPVKNLADLKDLAVDLANEFHDQDGNRRGEWHWNSYSAIGAPVPKGHIMDDSPSLEDYEEWGEEPDEFLEDPGHAFLLNINQTPRCKSGGDELHHPVPRKVALFVESADPALLIRLLDLLEDSGVNLREEPL